MRCLNGNSPRQEETLGWLANSNGGEQVAARLGAATADLGAEAAVLVVCGVLLALGGGGIAGHRTRLDPPRGGARDRARSAG